MTDVPEPAAQPANLPQLPLKSKIPTLCGTILICEILLVYLALLLGYGLRAAPVAWLIGGAVAISLVAVVALVTLPRKAGQNRPGIALGWVAQVLLVTSGLVLPILWAVGGVFAIMWGICVYWGRRIDREATAWAEAKIARASDRT